MTRLLVIELNEEGELTFSDASDEWSGWQLIGIGSWLTVVGEESLIPEDDG